VPRRGFEDAGCNGADKQQKDDVAGAAPTAGTAQKAVTADSTLLITTKKKSNVSGCDSTMEFELTREIHVCFSQRWYNIHIALCRSFGTGTSERFVENRKSIFQG